MSPWDGRVEVGWVTPTFLNSWVDFDSTGAVAATAAYRIDGNVVRLRGTVSSGSSGFSIFILPAGLRPSMQQQWVVPTNGGTGRVDVHTGGQVVLEVIHSGTNAAVSLDAISFIAEQ